MPPGDTRRLRRMQTRVATSLTQTHTHAPSGFMAYCGQRSKARCKYSLQLLFGTSPFHGDASFNDLAVKACKTNGRTVKARRTGVYPPFLIPADGLSRKGEASPSCIVYHNGDTPSSRKHTPQNKRSPSMRKGGDIHTCTSRSTPTTTTTPWSCCCGT